MKANVKGTLLEKFTRDVNTQNGKQERMYFRLYQEGERMNLDVSVKAQTYVLHEVGDQVELNDLSLNTFKDVIYAREF